MRRTAYQPATGPTPKAPYSPVVRIGDLVAVSGQVGYRNDGSLAGDDIRSQTIQTLTNLEAALHAAGASPDSVLKCTVYLRNLGDFAVVNELYREFFAEPFPARTAIGVELNFGLLIEIDALAVSADPSG